MANEFEKYGLSEKDKLIVNLLEAMLNEIQAMHESIKRSRVSPSG